MTYMLRNRPLTRQALGRAAGRGTVHGHAGLGGPVEIIEAIKFQLGIPSEELACLNTANASARVMEMDGKIEDLAKNWKPTGFYTPADITKIYNEVTENISKAQAALNTAIMSTSDAGSQVNQARTYLKRATDRGAIYPKVIAEAQAKGITVIDSPGLKTWVLESLVNVSQAYTTVEVLACRSTWLDYAAAAINKAWAVIKKIVGVVVRIGETVLKVADDLPQIWTIVKWGGIAAIGIAVAFKLKQMHDRR